MQITITSDPFANGPQLQTYHLRWMHGLLAHPIARATGIQPLPLKEDQEGPGFRRAEFFRASGLPFEASATLSIFDPEVITDASLDYAAGFLPRGSLLIGYELTESTRQVLGRLGVVYVDLWQHPIRFLDDVLIAFASNHPGIQEALLAFQLPEETCWLYGTRASTLLQVRGDGPALPPGSGVFIGQTLQDKAILEGGRYLNLLDFKEAFTAFCARRSRVYYSRHPMVEQGDEAILAFVSSFGNVVVGDCPAYTLLADPHVVEVMTISSSVGLEAPYFGKEVILLHRPVLPLGTGPDQYRTISQDFLSPHFWSAILSSMLPTLPSPQVSFLSGKDKLRDLLNWQYNYRILDKTEAMRAEFEELKRFKTTLAFLTAALRARADGHRTVLLCGAGGLAPRVARAVRLAGMEPAAFTDRNPRLQGTLLEGIPVVSLEEGLQRNLPCLVGSTGYTQEIARDILATAEQLGLAIPTLYLPEPVL